MGIADAINQLHDTQSWQTNLREGERFLLVNTMTTLLIDAEERGVHYEDLLKLEIDFLNEINKIYGGNDEKVSDGIRSVRSAPGLTT